VRDPERESPHRVLYALRLRAAHEAALVAVHREVRQVQVQLVDGASLDVLARAEAREPRRVRLYAQREDARDVRVETFKLARKRACVNHGETIEQHKKAGPSTRF
jgi:hypothetical protein